MEKWKKTSVCFRHEIGVGVGIKKNIKLFSLSFSVAKATLDLALSVRPSVRSSHYFNQESLRVKVHQESFKSHQESLRVLQESSVFPFATSKRHALVFISFVL